MSDKKEPFIFKPGDKVRCILTGVEGVLGESNYEHLYPLQLPGRSSFTEDGRLASRHIIPTLELIERPKKMVKKTVEGFAGLDKNKTPYRFDKERDMLSIVGCTHIVPATIIYEVEE